jgi:hypothetical protein
MPRLGSEMIGSTFSRGIETDGRATFKNVSVDAGEGKTQCFGSSLRRISSFFMRVVDIELLVGNEQDDDVVVLRRTVGHG